MCVCTILLNYLAVNKKKIVICERHCMFCDFLSPFALHFYLTSCFSNNNKWIHKTCKEKKREEKKRVKLLSGNPLRPFSERRFSRNKKWFLCLYLQKKTSFLLYCFPSPSVLVGSMEIALTDRCSYWSCNKSLEKHD